MTADADRIAELEAQANRHTALLSTIVGYLDADLKTSHLEGRRLDANTRSVTELERRVAELERAAELERRRHASSGDRRLLEAIARAGDPLEAAHAGHVAELLDPGHVVVNLESEPPAILGRFVRAEEAVAFYRDPSGEPRRAPLDCIAIVTRTEAEAIVNGRRPR